MNSFLLPTKDGKRSHVDFWLGQSPGTQDRWKENPSWIQSERKGDFFVDSSGIAVISRTISSLVWRRRVQGICHTTFRLLRTCTLLHLWKTLGHYGWMKSFDVPTHQNGQYGKEMNSSLFNEKVRNSAWQAHSLNIYSTQKNHSSFRLGEEALLYSNDVDAAYSYAKDACLCHKSIGPWDADEETAKERWGCADIEDDDDTDESKSKKRGSLPTFLPLPIIFPDIRSWITILSRSKMIRHFCSANRKKIFRAEKWTKTSD